MLILTRRPGESIMIERKENAQGEMALDSGSNSASLSLGDELITITILRVRNGQVSIGFKAPDHIAINREEIHRKKAKGNDVEQPQYTSSYDSGYVDSEEDYY